ncbi:MAG: hypothetical protein DMD79_12550 [Candidatus Rokuibacteriota bacterium]|nr:MAG: hypothetical protein DMD79_12550 [Candidatus Rokubacteria bacterium]
MAMTKRERVAAALARRPVDHPPAAFWRHAPDVDQTAAGLAGAMLAFHARYDLDVIKVMSSGVYCVEDLGVSGRLSGRRGREQAVRGARGEDTGRLATDHALGSWGRGARA